MKDEYRMNVERARREGRLLDEGPVASIVEGTVNGIWILSPEGDNGCDFAFVGGTQCERLLAILQEKYSEKE